MTDKENKYTEDKITEMSRKGLRVIAIGKAKYNNISNIQNTLNKCSLQFCGMIGLADPPRESVKEDIKTCIEARIRVVMITGDNGITARSIANQIGMKNIDRVITCGFT